MFTESHLISFGNYLLSTYSVPIYSNDGKNTPIQQREVSHADMQNWRLSIPDGVDEKSLPSQFQVNESVLLDLWGKTINAAILAVHFYHGKVKYDLECNDGKIHPDVNEPDFTRIYNVDSAFIKPFDPTDEKRDRANFLIRLKAAVYNRFKGSRLQKMAFEGSNGAYESAEDSFFISLNDITFEQLLNC